MRAVRKQLIARSRPPRVPSTEPRHGAITQLTFGLIASARSLTAGQRDRLAPVSERHGGSLRRELIFSCCTSLAGQHLAPFVELGSLFIPAQLCMLRITVSVTRADFPRRGTRSRFVPRSSSMLRASSYLENSFFFFYIKCGSCFSCI